MKSETERGRYRRHATKALSVGIVLSAVLWIAPFAKATSLGLDVVSGSWGPTGTVDGWTVGYEFHLASSVQVTGLGFWDHDSSFANTTFGLWHADGTFIGSVDSATSSIKPVATASSNGGSWWFMDFSIL